MISSLLVFGLAACTLAAPSPAPFTLAGGNARRDLAALPLSEQIAIVNAKYERSRQLALQSIAEGLLPKVPASIDDLVHSLLGKRAAVALTDDYSQGVDLSYSGANSLGTPLQTFSSDFDTGSSDLWVPVNCVNCGTTPQYAASKSSTYKASTTPFSVQYGSGACSGVEATDAVSFGGYKASSQAFGAVSNVTSSFANSASSGLTGLAWPSIASIRDAPTLTQTLNIPVYGYRITRGGSGSELDVGALNTAKYSGAIRYTPVTSKTYWQVAANSMTVNGVNVTSSFGAAIDTGTTLLYAPPAVVSAFWAKVPNSKANGDGSYSFPCSYSGTPGISFAGIPNVAFNRADLTYYQSSSTTCVGSVIAQSFNDAYGRPLAIVGDVFIKGSYTVFDVANARVGFATPV